MEWKISTQLEDYLPACDWMEQRVADIQNQHADECVWLLEHPPVFTAGTSANNNDLLSKNGPFPVYETGRGGQYTYHGPGQLIGYVMLSLAARNQKDLHLYVRQLEQWIIATLAELDIEGFRRQGRVGIWVNTPHNGECKIAAIGVRVKKWVTFHGIALNINPDLSHYQHIVPCGISQFGVTSLHELGAPTDHDHIKKVMQKTFIQTFA